MSCVIKWDWIRRKWWVVVSLNTIPTILLYFTLLYGTTEYYRSKGSGLRSRGTDNIMWTSNRRHTVSLDVQYSSTFYCMSYCIGRSIIRIGSLSILRDVITVMQSMSAIFRVTNQLNYFNSCELRNVIIIHVEVLYVSSSVLVSSSGWVYSIINGRERMSSTPYRWNWKFIPWLASFLWNVFEKGLAVFRKGINSLCQQKEHLLRFLSQQTKDA